MFVCLGDSASSSGVRRIEALTGQAAFDYLAAQNDRMNDLAGNLKARAEDVPERVKTLMSERKSLQSEVADLRKQLAMAGGGASPDAEEINGVKFFAQLVEGVSPRDLPSLIDEHKTRLESGAVLLIADAGGKAAVAAGVTDDLKDTLSAVDLVRAAVPELGGKGGGGRADMAQGGGKSIENAEAAISAAKAIIGG